MSGVSSLLAVAALLTLSTVAATYYPRPQYGSSPYRGLPECYRVPSYQIPVDNPQPSPEREAGSPPIPAFPAQLGAPDKNGLRTPIIDNSIPANTSSLADATLQQLFTMESGNSSVSRPQVLEEPFSCPVLTNSFMNSLPTVPGSIPTLDTAFYLYCYTRCRPMFVWKLLPIGYFPRYVRLAYCPTRNCSIPLGQTCRLESTRYVIVLKKHCCRVLRYELVEQPTQARPTPSRLGYNSGYPYYQRPTYKQIVRTEVKCGYYRVRIPTASTCRCACNQRIYRGRK